MLGFMEIVLGIISAEKRRCAAKDNRWFICPRSTRNLVKSSDRTPPLVSSDKILRAAHTLPSDTSFGSDLVALCNSLAAVACYLCIYTQCLFY